MNKKKVICFIIFLLIIITTIYFFTTRYFNKSQENIVETSEIIEEQQPADVAEEQQEVVDVSNIPEKVGDYDVLGELVIDKIGVDKNILAISEKASLKLSVAKLCGPNLSEPGNFCIDGHNWWNMLQRLSEVQVGDSLYIIDRNAKEKINYQVYNTYTCVPEDISCLYDSGSGKRELTIITCTPGAQKRFICKAREV